MFSEVEGLRWRAGGTPEENDEGVRAEVTRQCRVSSLVVVKETRLTEVGDLSRHRHTNSCRKKNHFPVSFLCK